jgi:hypothetical protein
VTAVAREEGQGSKGADYWEERKYLTEHSLMSLWEEGGWEPSQCNGGKYWKQPQYHVTQRGVVFCVWEISIFRAANIEYPLCIHSVGSRLVDW